MKIHCLNCGKNHDGSCGVKRPNKELSLLKEIEKAARSQIDLLDPADVTYELREALEMLDELRGEDDE